MSSQYTRHIIKLKAVINSEHTGELELLSPIRPNKLTIIKPIIKINLIMLGVIIFSKLKNPPFWGWLYTLGGDNLTLLSYPQLGQNSASGGISVWQFAHIRM